MPEHNNVIFNQHKHKRYFIMNIHWAVTDSFWLVLDRVWLLSKTKWIKQKQTQNNLIWFQQYYIDCAQAITIPRNNIWRNKPDLNFTGPWGVKNIGLSRVQSRPSSLSSVSLISASSLLSVVKILPSLLVIVWMRLSFSESDSPWTLLCRLNESEIRLLVQYPILPLLS